MSLQTLFRNYLQDIALSLQQISALISALASKDGLTVPATPAPPEFHAKSSDIVFNAPLIACFLYLLAKLIQTVIEMWASAYLQIFQRHADPLKRARVRQYSYEGMEKWKLRRISAILLASSQVIALLLISATVYHFNVNIAVAAIATTTAVIILTWHIWFTIAPIQDPQLPYQSLLSEFIWKVGQLIYGRTHRNNSTGGRRNRVSTNMMDGREQLAMDESDERRNRDARFIRSVVDGLTNEEEKLEMYFHGIPGTFHTRWGREVWGVIAAEDKRGRQRESTIGVLTLRITSLLKTCIDHGVLVGEDARRKRARTCITAALFFSLFIGDDLEWFARPVVMSQALNYLGEVETIRTPTPPHFDAAFSVRWVCMALVFVRRMLNTSAVQSAAHLVITRLAEVDRESVRDEDLAAAEASRIINGYLKSGWMAANILRNAQNDETEERVSGILDSSKSPEDVQVATKDLSNAVESLGLASKVDEATIGLVREMGSATGGVLDYLPTAALSLATDSRQKPSAGTRAASPHLITRFLPPLHLTRQLSDSASALKDSKTRDRGASQLGDLCAPELGVFEIKWVMAENPMMAQLWRLQDLCNGGYVFALELFMAAVRASKVSLHPSSQDLFINTFKSLTSEWEKHRNVRCTQRLLVLLLRQVLSTPADDLPTYIISEYKTFVAKALAGMQGPHVIEAFRLMGEFGVEREQEQGRRDETRRG
jgi:hypothetical protein